jgi:hypothetical protein
MTIKLSDLKRIIRESVDEAIDEMYGSKGTDISGKGQTSVDDLFNNGSMVVAFSDIEDIAYVLEHDAADAEKLYQHLLDYAEKSAAEFGYTKDVRGDFFSKQSSSSKSPVRVDDDGFAGNTELQEGKLATLKKLIFEAIEEIKAESKSVEEDMKSVSRVLKEHNKLLSLKKNKAGHYEVSGCSPTQIEIRPMMKDSYDVIFIKNGTDREKKMNLNAKGVRDFLKKKLEDDLGYTQVTYNQAATQVSDETSKSKGLPDSSLDNFKTVEDKKTKDKDFNESEVKDEKDLPEKPMSEVGKIKTQSDHDGDKGKAKYVFPKQNKEEKSHVVKGGKGKELKLPLKKIKKK